MGEEMSKKELRAQKRAQIKQLEKLKYRDMTDEQKRIYRKHEIKYWCTYLIVIAALYLILTFVVQIHPVFVHGDSMNPTFEDGNLTLCVNMMYEPKCGDVIVFKSESMGENLIKRVIATEGQTVYVDYDSSTVYVDGKAIKEDYVNEKTFIYYPDIYTLENPCTVPEGYVFAMGDNRNNSLDSRSGQVGMVAEDDIVGKVVLGGNK